VPFRDRRGAHTPQPFAKAAHRLLLDMWEYMGVDVHRYVDARVPENLLQDLHELLTLEPEGREGVPQGIECGVFREPGPSGQRLEVPARQVVAAHRTAERCCRDCWASKSYCLASIRPLSYLRRHILSFWSSLPYEKTGQGKHCPLVAAHPDVRLIVWS
jgi:hypothetical protein